MSAINTNGAGTASNVDSATTGTTVPGAPTGLTATASGTTAIDLSWSAPGSTGGSAITGYKIEVSPNGTSGWTDQVADTTSTATTYAHTGLAAGDTRHYRVSAINTNGAGTASNVDSATTGTSVPGAPTGLTATASGTTAINLSWSAPGSTGGSAITGYKIEVSPNGTSGWTDQVADTTSTATTYAHTGLAAGDTRHYRVSAINTNGAGTASNVDSATTGTSVPGAPTGLAATASGTTAINLSWSAPGSTGGSAITGYKIEVSPNGTSGWTDQVADTTSTATTYAHTGLAAGDTRHYRVSAINTNGAGTASNVDSATTGTNTPATGAPTITGRAQVGQTLPAGTRAIMDADGLTSVSYTYQWIRVDGGTETNISGATASTYTLVAADQGTMIKVRVSFTDDASNAETLTSAATRAVLAAANPPATGAPTIAGTAQVGQTLTAVTTAIMDANGLNNVSYTYQWIRVATDNTETNIASATASTYTLVAADQGTTIKVKVSFTDDASNAETLTSAATAAVTVSAPPDTTPPTLTSATVWGGEHIELQFSENIPLLNQPPGSAFTVTADGVAVTTPFSPTWAHPSTPDLLGLQVSPVIFRGQAVVVTYTDPTAGDDANAIQDTAGNDAATFTTGMNGVPAVTNNSLITNTPATGAPTITGTAQVGQTLTAGTTAIMDADGLTTPSYTYQWIRTAAGVETNISGATASTYTLVAADQGTTVKVRVSFTDDASKAETRTSAATAAVDAAPNTPATGAPTITGTAQVGQTLTAGTTAIMDADGLTSVSYTYQWIRVAAGNSETNISGATRAPTRWWRPTRARRSR